jgi:CRP-like cAMP-binding protein
MVDLDQFAKNYLVCGLSHDQIIKVAALAEPMGLTAGHVLISEGEAGGELYIVLNGRLNVLTSDGDKLAEVGPGSVLGEIDLIDAGPRSATVVSVGLVQVAVIKAKDLRMLMNSDRDLGFVVLCNLGRVLTGRLRLANAKLDELMVTTHGGAWSNAL